MTTDGLPQVNVHVDWKSSPEKFSNTIQAGVTTRADRGDLFCAVQLHDDRVDVIALAALWKLNWTATGLALVRRQLEFRFSDN